MKALTGPSLEDVRTARERIAGFAVRTPLVQLPREPGEREVWLKLETLQPVGSFKIRGAASALGLAREDELARGVFTASAGNMAQGVAWWARERGVPCTVVAPDGAPRAKLDAVERLGGRIVPVPFDRWWRVMVERRFEGLDAFFVHPVSDPGVMAGNATIALEILEDLPGAAEVYVPFGGGGLSCGIASGLVASGASTRVIACEVETAAPLAASFEAGRPVAIARQPSFVDGIGGGSVLEEMWPLASSCLAGVAVVSLEEIAAAIRTLVARARIVAEGAGASSLAAAIAGRAVLTPRGDRVARGEPLGEAGEPSGAGPAVCVVSGGGIDPAALRAVLGGEIPAPPA